MATVQADRAYGLKADDGQAVRVEISERNIITTGGNNLVVPPAGGTVVSLWWRGVGVEVILKPGEYTRAGLVKLWREAVERKVME